MWEDLKTLKDSLGGARASIDQALGDIQKIEVFEQEVRATEQQIEAKVEAIRVASEAFEREMAGRADTVDSKEKQWQKKMKDVERVSKPTDEIINLKVQNKDFSLMKSTLMSYPESLLYDTFSGAHPLNKLQDGSVFLENDPEAFGLLCNFLVYPELKLDQREKQLLQREMDFWTISKSPLYRC